MSAGTYLPISRTFRPSCTKISAPLYVQRSYRTVTGSGNVARRYAPYRKGLDGNRRTPIVKLDATTEATLPRLRRTLITAVAMAGLLSTMLAGTASAEHVDCGDVITTDTTLDSDVGPCPGHGLIVRSSNITLDLGGHKVFAANGPEETVGILLETVTVVTVQNGMVEGFDAGISIEGGSNNTIRRITAHNNVNDLSRNRDESGVVTINPDPNNCEYGDGILTLSSDENLIEHNRLLHNGPMSGIALVEDSDGNVVRKNKVRDQNVDNTIPSGRPDDPNTPRREDLAGACGVPFAQRFQDVGIRIEGPGADDNIVEGNRVERSMLEGISIHGYVCAPNPNEQPVTAPNTGNLILRNRVRENGGTGQGPAADGIGILQQGPMGIVCVSHGNTIRDNHSSYNVRDGIFVGGRGSHSNVIEDNVVNHNGRDGIRLSGPSTRPDNPDTPENEELTLPGAINNTIVGNRGHGNVEHDGHDDNPNCDNNIWRRNRFLTVNQPCVATEGTGSVEGPGL